MSERTIALSDRDDDARLGSLVRLIGTIGALLGIVVGVVDVAFGPSIRPWVGDKLDTTGLGTATILLSLMALGAAAVPTLPGSRSTELRLVAAAGLLIPAGICFTTAGRLWYAPGALLVCAGLVAVAWARKAGDVLATVERNWLLVLTTVLAGFYVFLGSVAWGAQGALGIVGGLTIVVALAIRRRSRLIAMLLLVVGALPFAIATWWSVVSPLMGLLALLLGGLAVRASRVARA
jgi:hypothetical protein